MKMHPSNPFFNPEIYERGEPSTGATPPDTSGRRSTNPFRRAKSTPTPTGQADDGRSCPDLTANSDSEPDPEILHSPVTTETPLSAPMPDPPQEGAASQQASASTASAPTSTSAAVNIPVDIRARRAGRRGLNLHVHWSDEEAAATASPSTPAPQHNEQPSESTTTTTEQPQNPPAQTPPNPPNQPPITPSAPRPPANTPNNMYIIQQPHVAYQAPVPMIMTNPPYVMPQQALPHWGPWCYPKRCHNAFWAGNAHHFTNQPIFIQNPIGQTMPTGPIFSTGPQNTYVFYH
ncbi:hypothetical protein PG993_012300 [Apiospora rasikravindrae]|uniref:Uncharacterized protein n=1 Tax=Apiospora rasikravindrae TaxID=990691 RepID=A0ABR1S222_9PEZI